MMTRSDWRVFRSRMRLGALLTVILFCEAGLGSASAQSASDSAMLDLARDSVVKIMVTARRPNYYQPWQFKAASQIVGSGFIIDGERILTNAHNIDNAVFIEVQRANDPKKYPARVQAASHQRDLALLRVEDETFFDGSRALSFGELSEPLDEVVALGFPEGGEELSISKGVVSRVERTLYAHSGLWLLGVQIDAAINPGNSGGPVMKGEKVVGVAMQALRQSENIGFIIPAPIAQSFLTDALDGRIDGCPDDGVVAQRADSIALKRAFKATPEMTGAFVNRVIYGSSADGILREGDIITHLDGIDIADDGSIELSPKLRVAADFLTQRKQIGDRIKIDFVRMGEKKRADVELRPIQTLIPLEFDRRPSYLIYGGLIFTRLTRNLIAEWGQRAPEIYQYHLSSSYPSAERSELVTIIGALPHRVNVGYHQLRFLIVDTVNGIAISSMSDLPAALGASEDGYVRIKTEDGKTIAIEKELAERSEREILESYGAPAPYSDDIAALHDALEKRPASN